MGLLVGPLSPLLMPSGCFVIAQKMVVLHAVLMVYQQELFLALNCVALLFVCRVVLRVTSSIACKVGLHTCCKAGCIPLNGKYGIQRSEVQ